MMPLADDCKPMHEIYVDGSTSATHAGWAAVVVACVGDVRRLLGVTGGTVALSPADPQWVGAERPDNIAAEFTAILAAHAIVLQQDPGSQYCIRPDLRLSRTIAQNIDTTIAHPTLAQLCRLLNDWNRSSTTFHEVRGHTNNPWNELADAIAKHCTSPDASRVFEFSFADLHALAQEPHDIAWDWTNYASPHLQSCLPPRFDQTVVQFPAFAAPTMQTQAVESKPEPAVPLALKIASINVLALEHTDQHHEIGRKQGCRTARIDHQFHTAGVHVVGLQETRTSQGQFQSDNYRIISSGCQPTPAPHLGCELWLHKSLPICTDATGAPVRLAAANAIVLVAEPRRLIVRLDFAACSCTFAVLHAPCLQKSLGDGMLPMDKLRHWWHETAEMLRASLSSTLVWVCIDANASLASHETPFYGLHDATRVGPQTECLEKFLQDLELFAPSTFAHFQQGPSPTWSHPNGDRHRIDYILANETAFHMTKSTSTMTTYDGSFTHEDHIPVLLEAQGWLKLGSNPDRIRWDEDALLDPVKCQAFQEALATLPLPTWQVHPNDHCAIYEKQLLDLAKQFFEQKKKTRRRPQLSHDTLQAIAMKRHLLDCGRAFNLMQDPDFKSELKAIET